MSEVCKWQEGKNHTDCTWYSLSADLSQVILIGGDPEA